MRACHRTLLTRHGSEAAPSHSADDFIGEHRTALRRLQREQEPKSPFVFTSERGAPFTTAGFARMLERAGTVAKLAFKAHPHMLRHACGYALSNRGHDIEGAPGLPWTSQHSAYGALYGAIAGAVQGFLALRPVGASLASFEAFIAFA